jgi:hypothetical protein
LVFGAWLAAIVAGSSGEPGGENASLAELAHVALGRGDEVVAAAEAGAVAGEGDRVDLGVEVGPLDALSQLDRHPRGDPVPPLRPVQGDASDPVARLIRERLEPRHRSTFSAGAEKEPS